jgi:hypothetical protein
MRLQIQLAPVLVIGLAALAASCSAPRREISLGTSGSLVVTFDSQQRVRSFSQFRADRSLKLKVKIDYGHRDINRLLVFASRRRQVWESKFTPGASSSCGSGEVAPGCGVKAQQDWSGRPGDIHDTRSWLCGGEILYKVHRTWPDDRSRVHYEVTGPSGIVLYTNTYLEK